MLLGDTRRQGIEASVLGRRRFVPHAGAPGGRIEWALHYTYLDARFETPFTELSATHPDAVGGVITVPAGARIRLQLKIKNVEKVEGGVRVTSEGTMEIEGGSKPVLVAETIGMAFD